MIALAIVGVTCLLMILSILFFPQIKLGKISLDSYWVVVLLGAVVIIACGQIDLGTLGKKFHGKHSGQSAQNTRVVYLDDGAVDFSR